jgi:hypothetical protein
MRADIPADAVILGVPAEALIPLLTDELLALSPALSRVRETTSAAIGSLTIKFNRRLAGLPRGIMTLERSRYGLTLVDNGQLWGLDTTLLNVVATDVVDLRNRDEPAAAAAIVDEVRRFIPFGKGDVDRVSYLPHERQPLFASTVGSWLFRPDVAGHARGLYVCGDYCRSHVGVVCVEAAVTTGLLAAQGCCSDFSLAETVDVKQPRELGRWTARICKLLLAPLVIVIVAWSSILAIGARSRTR